MITGSDHPRTIPEWLRSVTVAHADRQAIVGESGSLTYGQLDDRSRRWAGALLRHGAGKGVRIGIWMGNGPEWLLAWAAVVRMGAVAVPLSTFFSEPELARAMRHADLHGLILQRQFLGQDMASRLQGALPGLAGTDSPDLALTQAPYLRWVTSVDRDGDTCGAPPAWARTSAWLDSGGPDGVLEEAEREVHAADPAIMIYTSGSTADPKGVPHQHETVTFKTRYLRRFFALEAGTRSYIASPFFWVGGMTMSLFPVLDAGGTQYCTDRFDAGEVLALIERERIDRAVLYPHHINALLEHPDFQRRDRSSLRDADPRLLVGELAVERRDPAALQIGLGMTETFGGYWWGRRDGDQPPLRPGERRPPPLDALLPGVELKVVDPAGAPAPRGGRGEICIRGTGVTPGLHKQERSGTFDADGFFHTGDQAETDGERVWFRGRLGEMIKTAGANVAPAEVVEALRRVDGVAEAHVVGLADPVRGEVVAAAVVPAPGAVPDVDAIRGRLRSELSPFKVPVHIVVMSEADIPWTPSHKVRRGVLARMIEARLAAGPPGGEGG